MYYIYHIPGIKIGVTNNIKRRMRQQNFIEWEILEEHTDVNIVSKRERELQAEYGYAVDNVLYSHTISVAGRHGNNGDNGRNGAPKLYKLTMDIANQIRKEYANNKISHRALAIKYNISKQTIGRIVRNQGYIKQKKGN